MSNPNEAMRAMIEELLSRASAAGFSINGEVEHFPENIMTTEYARVRAEFVLLPGAYIDFTFLPPDGLSSDPECAVSYYGPSGNFMCMVYSDNIDAVMINYGRALNAFSADVIGSMKNEG